MTPKTTSGKSPYEIRLELIKLAQEALQTAFEQQMLFATHAIKMAQDAQWKSIEQLQQLMPKAFTAADVVAKANELYAFVQKRD